MISQENFKIALDAMWAGFVKAVGLVNTFAVMGLEVCDMKPVDESNPADSPKFLGFGDLYNVQGAMGPAIIRLVGGDPEMPTAKGATTLLEEIDFFLCEVAEDCPKSEKFPEEWYPKLMQILTTSGKITMPWLKDGQSKGRKGFISGGYWDNDALGVTKEYATVDEILADGFEMFLFELSCTSKASDKVEAKNTQAIQVWGRDYDDAERVLKSMTMAEIEEYSTLTSKAFAHKE